MKNLKFDIFSIIFLAEISRLALTVTKIERLNLIHNFLLKDFIFVLQENYFILFLRHQCVAHLYKIVYYLSDYYKGYVTKNNNSKKKKKCIKLFFCGISYPKLTETDVLVCENKYYHSLHP